MEADPKIQQENYYKMMVVFVRHGERADQKFGKSLLSNLITCDPYLTLNGKKQGMRVGQIVRDYVRQEKQEYAECLDLQKNIYDDPEMMDKIKDTQSKETLDLQSTKIF